MEVRLPNFLIVGAAKCGTTSLHYYLKQHPQIFMPSIKESFFFVEPKRLLGKGPGHFGEGLIEQFESYKSLYEKADIPKHIAIGEACVAYLYFYESAIPNIIRYLSKCVKIIIILRNPVERAFSNYLHHVRDELEPLSFEDALKNQQERKENNWWFGYQLIDVGLYYKQVKAYLESFDQVKIYLYDDFVKDPLSLIKTIHEFLKVDASFIPDIKTKYNVSGIPKNKLLYELLIKPNLLKTIVKPIIKPFLPVEKRNELREKRIKLKETLMMKNFEKPQMKPETREYLKNLYREDIVKLQDLIHRDLSHWLR